MNNSIAVPNQGPWPIAPYAPGQAQPLQPGQRTYSAASILDLPTLLRIGAKALQSALEGRKKGGTTAPPTPAPTVASPPSSIAGESSPS